MSQYRLVISTIGSEEEALGLARALVERRLVACVNLLGPVRSLYRWKGAVEEEGEHLLLMKTRVDRFEELAKAVEELHPYDVPELIALSVEEGAKSYLQWIDEQTRRLAPS